MDKPNWLKGSFYPVIKLPEKLYIHDFTKGEDLNPTQSPYSVGRYNECRKNMYTSQQYIKEQRNIHMGIDIAAPEGDPIFSFADGEIFLFADNNSEGDYGPTLITQHTFEDNVLYALMVISVWTL